MLTASVPVGLIAAAVIAAAIPTRSHTHAGGRFQAAPRTTAPRPASSVTPVHHATQTRSNRRSASPHASYPSTPGPSARRFLTGWLACVYHHAPCSQIADALPGYASALARPARSLATPAELVAHPEVVTLELLPRCGESEVAIATYTDGAGGRFQLHLDLVHEPAGWEVFDVAEAPPHIPLPTPLTRGPGGC